jgi:hypothetical protein
MPLSGLKFDLKALKTLLITPATNRLAAAGRMHGFAEILRDSRGQ